MVFIKILVVVGVVLASAVDAEVAKIWPCEGVSTNCTVGQVHINPCRQTPDPCFLKRGKKVQMDFDFTPDFSANKLKVAAYWPNLGKETKFLGFGSDDGCLYSTCPTVAGQQQLFNYTLSIGKKLPDGIFTFKWKVWNEDKELEDVCCFETTVNLR